MYSDYILYILRIGLYTHGLDCFATSIEFCNGQTFVQLQEKLVKISWGNKVQIVYSTDLNMIQLNLPILLHIQLA